VSWDGNRCPEARFVGARAVGTDNDRREKCAAGLFGQYCALNASKLFRKHLYYIGYFIFAFSQFESFLLPKTCSGYVSADKSRRKDEIL
jgi:hypothetical protein